MKRISLFAAGFIFAAIFAVSANAQTAPAGNPRIAVIDTTAFGAKDGITRYVNALNALENEFKPMQAELQTMVTRYQNLGKEIEALQKQATGGTVPIDQSAAQKKVDEAKSLELQMKRKEEDANRQLERRRGEVLGPISQDIQKAIQEFAAKNGYDIILDGARLDEAGLVLAFNPAKAEITKEFITFYNARPAGAATAAAPR